MLIGGERGDEVVANRGISRGAFSYGTRSSSLEFIPQRRRQPDITVQGVKEKWRDTER